MHGITNALRFEDKYHCIYHMMSFQAYVVEDNKQLILEGQLHVALQTIGKEACSLSQKEVLTHTPYLTMTLSCYSALFMWVLYIRMCMNAESVYKEYRVTCFSARDHCIFSMRLGKCILERMSK